MPGESASPLSILRAFVVQFRAETDVANGRYNGRIEHIATGRVIDFVSLTELLEFIGNTLAQVVHPNDASCD